MLNAIGEEGNGKPPQKIHFPRQELRALSLASAKLEIEYATQFFCYINSKLRRKFLQEQVIISSLAE